MAKVKTVRLAKVFRFVMAFRMLITSIMHTLKPGDLVRVPASGWFLGLKGCVSDWFWTVRGDDAMTV